MIRNLRIFKNYRREGCGE